jgi:hypothetical protein
MLKVMAMVFIGMTALYAVRIALEQFEFNRKERSSPITKEHKKLFNL